jgi:hypothetical protein
MAILLYTTKTPVYHQVTMVVKDDECRQALREVIERGLNTWQRQCDPIGAQIRAVLEALK